jgi:general secretion pathway protein A
MSVQMPAGSLYTAHFGLMEAPFSITPDPGYLYMSARHQEALAHLMYGIGEGGGFVQLTGEVGTGKTTLCRYLTKHLPPHVDVALILNPRVTAGELLAAVCDELRVPYDREAGSPKGLVDGLYRYLLDAHGRGRRTVLIIDEAQNLNPEVLEQIRLLTNLETEKEKLLQIVLIGQPELTELLGRPQLRQLAQRITARYHLDPLSERETVGYVRHRLRVAGQKDVVFGNAAVREVYRLSGGVPRLINVICDRALLGAYARNQARISPALVRQAASEVLGRRVRSRAAVAAAWIAAGAALLAAGGAAAWYGNGLERLRALVATDAGRAPAPAALVADAPPGPPPAAAAPAAPAGPRLAEALGTPGLRTDRQAAFTALFGAWQVPAEGIAPEQACEHAVRHGLRCLFRTGTWFTLRRFDLPAVLELLAPDGSRHYAAVVGMDRGTATLAFGADRRTASFGEIDLLWDGQFMLLWRAQGVRTIPLAPGMRGRDVEWLRARLDQIDGHPAPAQERDVYDDGLRQRVIAFQASRSLIPDGIVGEETLTHLSAAGGADVPRLVAAGP